MDYSIYPHYPRHLITSVLLPGKPLMVGEDCRAREFLSRQSPGKGGKCCIV